MNAPLFFRIYKNGQMHLVKQFVNDERIVIGQGSGVQIDLASPEVSSIHCLVEKREGGYYLCDLGSEQGTFVKGAQILDQQIVSGDHFEIGPFSIYFMQGNQKNLELEERDRQPQVKIINPPPSDRVEQTATVRIEIDTNQNQPMPSIPAAVEKTSVPPPRAPEAKSAPPPKAPVKPAASAPAAKLGKAQPLKAHSLKDYIRVGAGSRVEVIVSWRERILTTYHFSAFGERSLGGSGDINVPEGTAPKGWKILNYTGSQLEVNTTSDMKVEIIRDGDLRVITENKFFVRESEVCFIELNNGMQLAIRFAPKAPPIIFDSPFVLGISEFTG
ncbi:MAG: FHA domain-containing protein, partial [Pseudobdellovibrio sp.]